MIPAIRFESQIRVDVVNVENMLKASVELAAEAMYKNGRILTTFFGFLPSGSIFAVVTPFHNETEKQILLAVVRAALKEHHCVGYTTISEAWLSMRHKSMGEWSAEQIEEHYAKRPPSQDPNRVEVVWCVAVTRTARKGKALEIKRNWKGKFTHLVDYDFEKIAAQTGVKPPRPGEDFGITGTFAELLD
jgi:hypothetical protein